MLDVCLVCAVTHAVSNFTILQVKTAIMYIVADGENLSEHKANFLKLIYQRWTDFLSSVHHSLVESVSRLVCTRDYTVIYSQFSEHSAHDFQ